MREKIIIAPVLTVLLVMTLFTVAFAVNQDAWASMNFFEQAQYRLGQGLQTTYYGPGAVPYSCEQQVSKWVPAKGGSTEYNYGVEYLLQNGLKRGDSVCCPSSVPGCAIDFWTHDTVNGNWYQYIGKPEIVKGGSCIDSKVPVSGKGNIGSADIYYCLSGGCHTTIPYDAGCGKQDCGSAGACNQNEMCRIQQVDPEGCDWTGYCQKDSVCGVIRSQDGVTEQDGERDHYTPPWWDPFSTTPGVSAPGTCNSLGIVGVSHEQSATPGDGVPVKITVYNYGDQPVTTNIEAGVYSKEWIDKYNMLQSTVGSRNIEPCAGAEEPFVAAAEITVPPKENVILTLTPKAPKEGDKLFFDKTLGIFRQSNWDGFGNKYAVVVGMYDQCFDEGGTGFCGQTTEIAGNRYYAKQFLITDGQGTGTCVDDAGCGFWQECKISAGPQRGALYRYLGWAFSPFESEQPVGSCRTSGTFVLIVVVIIGIFAVAMFRRRPLVKIPGTIRLPKLPKIR